MEANIGLLGGWLIYDREGSNPNTKRPYDSVSTTVLAPSPVLGVSSPLGTDDFGFGYTTYFPGGAWADYDEQGSQRYDIISGLLLPWHHQLTLAYRPHSSLSLAASGIVSVGFFETELDVDVSRFISKILDRQEIPAEHDALTSRAHIPRSTTHGYGYALGIYYSPNFQWSTGLSFFSPISYQFNNSLSLSSPSIKSTLGPSLTALGMGESMESRAVTKLSLPAFIQAGIRYQPFGYWNGEYFFRYIFSSMEDAVSLSIRESTLNALEGQQFVGTKIDDSYTVGMVQSLSLWKTLTFGLTTHFNRNGVRDHLLSPSRVDFDSLLAGAYGKWNWTPSFILGLEYSHTFMFEREGANTGPSLTTESELFQPASTSGKYRAALDRLGVSIKYVF